MSYEDGGDYAYCQWVSAYKPAGTREQVWQLWVNARAGFLKQQRWERDHPAAHRRALRRELTAAVRAEEWEQVAVIAEQLREGDDGGE